MVLYNCNKCGRKTTFDLHINIKFSCVKIKPNKKPITYTELKNKNEELEDKIQQIQNELLKNKEVIKCFSNHTNITKMDEYGKECFQGDKNELLNEILQIVKNYNN